MEVTLNHDTHTYTNKDGEVYQSVTTLIGEYQKPFNVEFFAAKTAKKRGITTEAVIQEWKEINHNANVRGTGFHLIMEEFLKTKNIPKENEDIINSFKSKTYDVITNGSEVFSERLLYSHKHKLAGTADLIVVNGDYFHILDFKTNKKFDYFSKYNEYFFAPLSHLQVSKLSIYSIQMSIYARLFEDLTHKKCAGLRLLYLKEYEKKRYWQDINALYMKETVDNILNDRLTKITK